MIFWVRVVSIYRRVSSHSSRPHQHAPLSSSSSRSPDKMNYNQVSFIEYSPSCIARHDRVTANDLRQNSDPPRGVDMLVRDFIEDSLYNPHYGYFSNHATIFDSLGSTFAFSSLKDSVEFQEEVAKRYAEYESNRQLWHTPTELFKV